LDVSFSLLAPIQVTYHGVNAASDYGVTLTKKSRLSLNPQMERRSEMLQENALDALLRQHDITEAGQCLIKAIRKSDPSRRTRSGPKNVACRYPSKKMGLTIQAESHTNELAALYE